MATTAYTRGFSKKKLHWHDDEDALDRIPRFTATLFPSAVRTTLEYSAIASNAGGVAVDTPDTFYYGVNNVYDPFYSGSGHQPYYYDQWAAFFPYYLCISSEIRVTVSTVVTDDGLQWCSLGVLHYPQSTPSAPTVFLENPQWQTSTLALNTANPNSSCNLRAAWDLLSEPASGLSSYMEGLQSNWSAAIGAGPSYAPLYECSTFSTTGSTQVVQWWITVRYEVIFYSPVIPVVS